MARRQFRKLTTPTAEERTAADEKCTRPPLDQRCEGGLHLAVVVGIHEQDFLLNGASRCLYLCHLELVSRTGVVDKDANNTGIGHQLTQEFQRVLLVFSVALRRSSLPTFFHFRLRHNFRHRVVPTIHSIRSTLTILPLTCPASEFQVR